MSQSRGELESFLGGIALFGGLETDTLTRLCGRLRPLELSAGQRICQEGEPGRAMYVVRQGEVLVALRTPSGRRVRLVRLGEGEFFGEMSLIDPQPRSATVTAERPSLLYALTGSDLYALYREDLPGYALLMQNLCRELVRRLRRADVRICQMASAGEEDHTQLGLRVLARSVT